MNRMSGKPAILRRAAAIVLYAAVCVTLALALWGCNKIDYSYVPTATDATPTDATATDATSTDATPTDATATDATVTDAA